MKHSDKSISAAIIMFLLIITTYTYILLLFSNNRPLFAEIRVLGHGRSSTLKELNVSQNTNNSSNTNRKKDLLSSIIIENITRFQELNGAYRHYGIPSNNSSQLTTTAENNHANFSSQLEKGVRIALVEPTFTAAAYNNSFYAFYSKYSHVSAGLNITNDLNLLTSKVITYPTITPTTKVHSAFAMLSLLKNLKLISPDSDITVLTDTDVDDGLIFNEHGARSVDTNSNAYDVIILGHQEYVTQKEYDNLRNFVSNGGSMILLDGNVFYAQVKFDRSVDTITLVKGHGWAFNGESAWKSVSERWAKETSQWVGSNYLCYSCNITFANDPWEYQHHEEQYITNPGDKILMNYNASLLKYPISSLRPVIAIYELNYQKGKVISLGIYSDDIITNEKFDRYFDNLVLQYAPHIKT